MTDRDTTADPNCPRCHGSGIAPDSKPMYHDGAPGIPDPAGYEPCDCVLMAATDRDTTPAGRIQAYLEWEDDSEDAFIAAIHDDDGNRRSLQVADVRAVLTEHQAMLLTLWRMIDDEPCEVDHNGHCQTHGLSLQPCTMAEARRLVGDWKPVDDA